MPVVFLAALVACSNGAAGTPVVDAGVESAEPGTVPITLTPNGTHGGKSFAIPIDIGGTALDVWFDTGSAGLRILPGALPDTAFASISSTPVSYSFSSGVELRGVVAQAVVTVGGLTTPGPIPVMLVQTVSCLASKPTCDTSAPFLSYKAILGVGYRTTATAQGVGSPLAQLPGHPAFVVDVSSSASSGVLRIGPSADAVSAYATFQLPALDGGVPLADGTPAWDDHALPVCISGYPAGTSYCEGGVMDTGVPWTYIAWAADTSPTVTVFPSGTDVSVTLGPNGDLGAYAFTVGSTPTPGVDEVELEAPLSAPYINLGTKVFFQYSAYFDPLRGIEGLAPH